MKEPIMYTIVTPIIRILFKLVYHPQILGRENISKENGIILAGNHTNFFDCLLIMSSTKRCVHFLAKDSLYKGFKKVIFKNMGIIPVNRKVHDKNALNEAIKYLDDDKVIGIFPEGTINKTKDTVMPFKIGAVKMSSSTHKQIVPFTITGSYNPFKFDLTIKFDKAYYVKNEDLDGENKKLMNKISSELIRRKNGIN